MTLRLHISPTARRLLLAAAAVGFLTSGCTDIPVTVSHDPVFHCSSFDIWPDSIDLHSGIILKAVGDSAIQVRVDGNTLRTLKAPRPDSTSIAVTTGIPIFDLLYRLESAAITPAGTYTTLLPYELYLNPLNAKDGIKLLESREKNGYIIPLDTRRYSWPVINDNPQWLLAAAELFKVTGNRRWLEKTGKIAANVTAEDFRVAYNPVTSLIGGVPRHLATSSTSFPDWMEPVDLFNSATLSVNTTYWSALQQFESITSEMAMRNEKSHLPELPFDADNLRHNILRQFWMPNVGMLSAIAYGYPLYPVSLKSSDNFAQALAVVTGLLSDPMANTVISHTPVASTGIELFSPSWPGSQPSAAVTSLTRTLWTIAASRTSDTNAYNAALGHLMFHSASSLISGHESHTSSAPLHTVVIRAMLGMQFATDGISFSPSVPSGMPGSKTIHRLRYRKATLDITINGTGNEIASFKIDGNTSTPFLPASTEGLHTISIELTGNGIPTSPATPTTGTLPASPSVEWVTPRNATVTSNTSAGSSLSDESKKYFTYLNGVITDEFLTRHFQLYQAPATTSVQIVEVRGDRWMSFSAKPHLYIPESSSNVIYLSQFTRTGSRIITDRKLAERFVETNRWNNRTLTLSLNITDEADYAIDVHYLNGLGIVNSRRRTAIRALSIDGQRAGILVFPQLTTPQRDTDPNTSDSWQSMTSFTNPVKVHLTPGPHTISLTLYQPSPVYIDPYTNVVLADFVRISKLL